MSPCNASSPVLGLLVLASACRASAGEHDGAGHSELDIDSVPVPAVTGPAVLVVSGKGNSVVVVDPESLATVATIKLRNVHYPHHINVSPDGARVVIAVPGEDLSGGHGGHDGHGEATMGALLVLAADTGKKLAARHLPAPNHNGVFSPDGSAIWTGQMGEPGKVLALDPETLETRQEVAVGSMPAEVTVSADGRYLFVANGGSDDVSVIDLSSRDVVKTIAVGDNPVGAWPGADNVMYVDNESGETISAIDVATLAVTRTFELGFMPGMATLSPAKDELWVTDAEGGSVTFWSLDDGTKTGEVPTGAGAHAVVFAPDGARAFVTNQQDDSLSVVDVAARSVIKTLPIDGQPNGLVFRSALP